MKKLIVSMLVMLLLVTGCGKVPVLSNGKEAVVSLDNGGISVDELYEEMKNKYALSVLIDMMDEKILSEKYPESDEEKKYVSNMLDQLQLYYDYYYNTMYDSYELFIQSQYGVTNNEALKEIFSLDYKRNKAVEDYVKESISESDINKYYEEKTVGNIEASHILITADYEDNATDEEKKAAETKAYEKAKEIITKLNNGEDFATLAKENSKDGSAANGGALGSFNRGEMVDEFFEAALALKVNEYSKEPVKSEFGYHIILKTAQQEKPTLESVKDEIIETLADEKKANDEKLSYKALAEIRKESGMTIEDKDLQKQYENYLYNTTE